MQHVAELIDLTESDKDLTDTKHYTAQTFMFKANRCFYLSESYTIMKKWSESIGLLVRSEEHVIQAIGLYREWGKTEGEVSGYIRGINKGYMYLSVYCMVNNVNEKTCPMAMQYYTGTGGHFYN